MESEIVAQLNRLSEDPYLFSLDPETDTSRLSKFIDCCAESAFGRIMHGMHSSARQRDPSLSYYTQAGLVDIASASS